MQEIADWMDVARTAAVHHVRILIKEGHVRAIKKGKRKHHYSTRTTAGPEDDVVAHLRLERARALIIALQEEPGASWRRLAKRLDVTPRAIRWHIQRMEEDGVLRVQRIGDSRHVVVLHPSIRGATLAPTDAPTEAAPALRTPVAATG